MRKFTVSIPVPQFTDLKNTAKTTAYKAARPIRATKTKVHEIKVNRAAEVDPLELAVLATFEECMKFEFYDPSGAALEAAANYLEAINDLTEAAVETADPHKILHSQQLIANLTEKNFKRLPRNMRDAAKVQAVMLAFT